MDGAPDGKLALAVFTRHKAVDVADIRGERRAQKIAETRAVEHGTRAHDLARRQARLLQDDVGEHVHGVGDDDDDTAVVVLHDVLRDVARDADVLGGKVKARFARLSAETRGNDDDVAVLDVGIGAAVDVHRPHRDEAVADIHRFTFGLRRVDVDDGELGNEPLRRDGECRRRAHGACADDADLGMSAHVCCYLLKCDFLRCDLCNYSTFWPVCKRKCASCALLAPLPANGRATSRDRAEIQPLQS